MTEQINSKPLLKILKNILKYGMRNKKDSKQLLETVNCVLTFGVDSMMNEYIEKNKKNDFEKEEDYHEKVDLISENDYENEPNEDKKDKMNKINNSLNKNSMQIVELKTLIESNKQYMEDQTQVIAKVINNMNALTNKIQELIDEKSSQSNLKVLIDDNNYYMKAQTKLIAKTMEDIKILASKIEKLENEKIVQNIDTKENITLEITESETNDLEEKKK